MIQLGRNAPCHCGSGKKYKQCCLDKDFAPEPQLSPLPMSGMSVSGPLQDFLNEIGPTDKMSKGELNKILGEFQEVHNNRPMDDLLGLTPERMYNLMHFPVFSEESGLTLVNEISRETFAVAPVVKMSEFILRNITQSGKLKATAKQQNLPRSLAQAFGLFYESEISLDREKPLFPRSIMSEWDVPFLPMLKFLLRECGLLKLRSGYYSLTQKGEAVVDRGFEYEDFINILTCHMVDLDWCFLIANPLNYLLQDSVPFLLFALNLKAVDWLDVEDFAERIYRAFPELIDEMYEDEMRRTSAIDLMRIPCYHVFLRQFTWLHGLVELKEVREGKIYPPKQYCVKTKLFNELLNWKF